MQRECYGVWRKGEALKGVLRKSRGGIEGQRSLRDGRGVYGKIEQWVEVGRTRKSETCKEESGYLCQVKGERGTGACGGHK